MFFSLAQSFQISNNDPRTPVENDTKSRKLTHLQKNITAITARRNVWWEGNTYRGLLRSWWASLQYQSLPLHLSLIQDRAEVSWNVLDPDGERGMLNIMTTVLVLIWFKTCLLTRTTRSGYLWIIKLFRLITNSTGGEIHNILSSLLFSDSSLALISSHSTLKWSHFHFLDFAFLSFLISLVQFFLYSWFELAVRQTENIDSSSSSLKSL